MTVQEIYDCFDRAFPYCMQESYDNSGILIDCGKPVTKVIVALDITNRVVEFAASEGADLIVSHHPVIFSPIKRLQAHTPVFGMIGKGISAIAVHTNFDIADGGVNNILASKLGLQNIRPVFKVSECIINGRLRENYIGRMGELSVTMEPAAFAAHVGKTLLGRTAIEYVDGGRPVRRVAVGGGACGEFTMDCRKSGIDAYVTGEAKHHQMVYAVDNGLTLVAAGHYATENIALEKLADTMREAFPDLPVLVTRVDAPLQFSC